MCGQRGEQSCRPPAEHTRKAVALLQEPGGSCYILIATAMTELGVSVRTWSKWGIFFPV